MRIFIIFLIYGFAISGALYSFEDNILKKQSEENASEKFEKILEIQPKTQMIALVTGVTGQDGSYLSKFLLEKGYEVHGTFRRTSTPNFWRIDKLGVKDNPKFHLVECDITDAFSCLRAINEVRPREVYSLAAQSFVGVSFKEPLATANITGIGPLNLLEAIKNIDKNIKFYQASTSELFGLVQENPQTEKTPFYPRSPYGVAKLFAHWSTINYRESYGMFACCGILFNHESPLRGSEFVTRKITEAIARIKYGKQDILELGNLDSKRDWGFAGDYVEAMYLMLQHEKPEDYVIATNRTESIRFFVEKAFARAGMEIEWHGSGIDEYGIDKITGKTVIKIDPKFFRPAEVDILMGNPAKAKESLGWTPKVTLEKLIDIMVDSDLEKYKENKIK